MISIAETLMAPKTKKRVRNARKAGLCLRSDLGCTCKAAKGKRGLCDEHWNHFRYAKSLQPEKSRKKWDAMEVRAGRVAESRRGRRSTRNPYLNAHVC